MSKHTPGPWVVDDLYTERGNQTRVSATDGRTDYYLRCPSIAECHVGDGVHVLQAEANARLIAQAPALLAMLERTEKWINESFDFEMPLEKHKTGCALRDDIRALLKSARGNQS